MKIFSTAITIPNKITSEGVKKICVVPEDQTLLILTETQSCYYWNGESVEKVGQQTQQTDIIDIDLSNSNDLWWVSPNHLKRARTLEVFLTQWDGYEISGADGYSNAKISMGTNGTLFTAPRFYNKKEGEKLTVTNDSNSPLIEYWQVADKIKNFNVFGEGSIFLINKKNQVYQLNRKPAQKYVPQDQNRGELTEDIQWSLVDSGTSNWKEMIQISNGDIFGLTDSGEVLRLTRPGLWESVAGGKGTQLVHNYESVAILTEDNKLRGLKTKVIRNNRLLPVDIYYKISGGNWTRISRIDFFQKTEISVMAGYEDTIEWKSVEIPSLRHIANESDLNSSVANPDEDQGINSWTITSIVPPLNKPTLLKFESTQISGGDYSLEIEWDLSAAAGALGVYLILKEKSSGLMVTGTPIDIPAITQELVTKVTLNEGIDYEFTMVSYGQDVTVNQPQISNATDPEYIEVPLNSYVTLNSAYYNYARIANVSWIPLNSSSIAGYEVDLMEEKVNNKLHSFVDQTNTLRIYTVGHRDINSLRVPFLNKQPNFIRIRAFSSDNNKGPWSQLLHVTLVEQGFNPEPDDIMRKFDIVNVLSTDYLNSLDVNNQIKGLSIGSGNSNISQDIILGSPNWSLESKDVNNIYIKLPIDSGSITVGQVTEDLSGCIVLVSAISVSTSVSNNQLIFKIRASEANIDGIDNLDEGEIKTELMDQLQSELRQMGELTIDHFANFNNAEATKPTFSALFIDINTKGKDNETLPEDYQLILGINTISSGTDYSTMSWIKPTLPSGKKIATVISRRVLYQVFADLFNTSDGLKLGWEYDEIGNYALPHYIEMTNTNVDLTENLPSEVNKVTIKQGVMHLSTTGLKYGFYIEGSGTSNGYDADFKGRIGGEFTFKIDSSNNLNVENHPDSDIRVEVDWPWWKGVVDFFTAGLSIIASGILEMIVSKMVNESIEESLVNAINISLPTEGFDEVDLGTVNMRLCK